MQHENSAKIDASSTQSTLFLDFCILLKRCAASLECVLPSLVGWMPSLLGGRSSCTQLETRGASQETLKLENSRAKAVRKVRVSSFESARTNFNGSFNGFCKSFPSSVPSFAGTAKRYPRPRRSWCRE